MTLRELISSALKGGEPERIPLHCRIRFALSSPEREWLKDLGWGIMDHPPVFSKKYKDCVVNETAFLKNGQQLILREMETNQGVLRSVGKPCYPNEYPWSGSTVFLEYLFKTPDDYPAILSIINSICYEADYDEFLKIDNQLGDTGYSYCWAGYDPMHEIALEIMGVEKFSYEWADNRKRVLELYEALSEKHRMMYRLVSKSPAELVIYGGNIQPSFVSPKRFESYYLPCYEEFGAILHATGKRMGAHLDDKSRNLSELFIRCPWDVMEALAVIPDGDISIAEARKLWPNRVLSILFPSKALHLSSIEIQELTRKFVKEAGSTKGFLISLTEEIPEECKQRVFSSISQAVQNF
jgi:hypothetical protein